MLKHNACFLFLSILNGVILGGPALGLIPAESDLCQSAQNGSAPLVMFVPESNIAASLIALAERLAAGRQQLAGAV
jgi:hypothetical protein